MALPEKYCLGDHLIDFEHARLYDLLQELKSEKIKDLKMVFAELKYYTKTHFVVEEEMMLAFRYPDYRSHKATHELFLSEITQFEQDIHSEKSYFSKSLIAFLEQWLIQHINIVDRKAIDFIQSQQAK